MSNGGEGGQGNFPLEIAAVTQRSSAGGLGTTGEPLGSNPQKLCFCFAKKWPAMSNHKKLLDVMSDGQP